MCHTVGQRNGHQSVPWCMVLKYPHFLFPSACGFKVWKWGEGRGKNCKNVSYGRDKKNVSHWWAKLQYVNHSGLNSQQKCKPWMNNFNQPDQSLNAIFCLFFWTVTFDNWFPWLVSWELLSIGGAKLTVLQTCVDTFRWNEALHRNNYPENCADSLCTFS